MLTDEEKKQKRRAYYEKNKERIKAFSVDYYYKNKEVVLEKKHKRIAESPDKYKEIYRRSKRKRAMEDPIGNKWRSLRQSARSRGLEFSISVEDIKELMTDTCPVLGIPMKFNPGCRAGTNHDSYSVDRVDNNKGYTKDNIQIISRRANTLKNDATLEELERVVAYMRKQQGEK